MAACDLIVATGSSGLTKAAYESGTPAYGVGPGNPPAILDDDFDLNEAAKLSVVAIASDNGILCDGDNLLLYPAKKEADFFARKKALQYLKMLLTSLNSVKYYSSTEKQTLV